MTRDLRFLVLEDSPADLALIERELAAGGLTFTTRRVETRDAFLGALEAEPPDVILSDHGLPTFNGFAALQEARARRPEVPFIFVTGSVGEERAVDSLRLGATDYVLKGRLAQLVPAVERALRLAGERARRQRAEAELAASEARKAAVLTAALDAIVSIDADGRILEWNPAAERIFGYTRELAVGRTLAALVLPGGAQAARRELARLLHGGRGRQLGQRAELVAVRAHGAEFPVEVTMARVAGEPVTYIGFIRDITDRRRAEEALRRGEERFRLLVEGVEDYAIFLLDPHGRIHTWNAGGERITGHRPAEAIGRRFHRCFTAEDIARGQPDQALAVATAEGRFRDERPLARRDGTTYHAHFVLTALRDSQGSLAGFSAIVRDISRRHQAEEEIRRLNAALARQVEERNAELAAVHREMEAFTHTISHDLRSPLIHIAGFVEMLTADLGPRLDADSARHLRTIADSTEHLGRMLADLLAYSRLGRAELRRLRVPLGDLVREVQREVTPPAGERRVTWRIGELPEVSADPVLLRQALGHLLGNAIKFTRPRADACIEVTARNEATGTVVTVRDNGVGFDAAHAGKLFGVFQRLHGASEFDGNGIGLAMVRRIIQRHGGRVWAEAPASGGAAFSFSLPAEAPA